MRTPFLAFSKSRKWNSGQLGTRSSGFSLIELLVVIAIMSIMATLTMVGFSSFAANNFGQEIYTISSTFDQARAYALANNTYVFVGITEVDATQLSSAVPQAAGGGRIALSVVASCDGTRMYDQGSSYWQNNLSNLKQVIPLQHFDNTHLADFSSLALPTAGGMVRPLVSSNYSLANSPSTGFGFNWPLTTSAPQYTFTKVVAFSPSGEATLLPTTYSLASSGILTPLELDLQPTHGSQIPVLPSDQAMGNQAALQIDGVSGLVNLYQP